MEYVLLCPKPLSAKTLKLYGLFLFEKQFQLLKKRDTSILYLEKSLELTIQKFRPSHVRSIKKQEKRVLKSEGQKIFNLFLIF